jgi:hypothetical protein
LDDVVNADAFWVQRIQDWLKGFGYDRTLLVLIDCGDESADRAAAIEASRWLAESLSQDPRVSRAFSGFDTTEVHPKLLMTQPTPMVQQVMGQLKNVRPMLAASTPGDMLMQAMRDAAAVQTNNQNSETEQDADSGLGVAADVFVSIMTAFERRVEQPEGELDVGLLDAMRDAVIGTSWQPIFADSDHLLVIVAGVEDQPASDVYRAVRSYTMSAGSRFDVEIHVTGAPALRTELEPQLNELTLKIIAGLAAGLLLLCGFAWRSLRYALLLAVSWLWVAAMTLASSVLLLGNTVGFGLLVAYLMVFLLSALSLVVVLGAMVRSRNALRAVVAVGPGVLTLVTLQAAAVLPVVFADLPLLRTIAVVAICGAVYTGLGSLCLPIALERVTRPTGRRQLLERRGFVLALRHFAGRRRRGIWITSAVVFAAMVTLSWWVPRGGSVLNLLPQDSTAVQGLQILDSSEGVTQPFAASLHNSLAAVQEQREKYKTMSVVAGVGGAGMLVSDDEPGKLAARETLRQYLADALQAIESGPDGGTQQAAMLPATVRGFAGLLNLAASRASPERAEAFQEMREAADRFTDSLGALPADESQVVLAAIQQDYTAARRELAAMIESLTDPQSITLDTLGDDFDLFSQWVMQKNGQKMFAMYIYPAKRAGDQSEITNRDFISQMRRVVPDLTGPLAFEYDLLIEVARPIRNVGGAGVCLLLIGLAVCTGRWWAPLVVSVTVIAGAFCTWFLLGLQGQPVTLVTPLAWVLPAFVLVGFGCLLLTPGTARSPNDSTRYLAVTDGCGLLLAAMLISLAAFRSIDSPALLALAGAVAGGMLAASLMLVLLSAAAEAWAVARRPGRGGRRKTFSISGHTHAPTRQR